MKLQRLPNGYVRNPVQHLYVRLRSEALDKRALRRLRSHISRLHTTIRHVMKVSQNVELRKGGDELLSLSRPESPFEARQQIQLIRDYLDQWMADLVGVDAELDRRYREVRFANVDISTPAKKSKYRGVRLFRHWKGRDDLWTARLHLDRRHPIEKYAKSEVEAALVYDDLVREHLPEETWRLNFVAPGESVVGRPLNLVEKRARLHKYFLKREELRPKGGTAILPSETCDELLDRYGLSRFNGEFTNV